MKAFRLFACTLVLGGSLMTATAQAQDLTLADLFFGGVTFAVHDKVFRNWQLDDFNLGPTAAGSLDDIVVTPLDDDPLNPGIKFSSLSGLQTGNSFVVLEFSFDVQTASGQPLIKDNSLWLNGFTFVPGFTGGVINIRESISDVTGAPLGSKFVTAMRGDVPGDPDHFDSAEFEPQSFVHVFKGIELVGEGVILTMFEQRFSQVPEPSSMVLLAIGLVAAWWARARRR
jgi:hypothetical protein